MSHSQKTMQSVSISAYCDKVDGLVSLSSSLVPELRKGDGNMLVKVLAVSLAPGDCRVLSGKTSLVQGPPSFPYIPGGDLCGIVVQVHDDEKKFRRGDSVVAMFDTIGPRGALAEYKLVKTANAAIKPPSLSPEQACALPSSALSAMILCENCVRQGDRVLVLGGAGGVGTHLVQMLKPNGASFVAATSTQKELLQRLGVDHVVDYRTEKWWEKKDFCSTPFDLVVDLWGTREPWDRAVSSSAVKSGYSGGRYVTMVGDTPCIVLKHWWQVFRVMWDMLARALWTSIFRSNPRWHYHVGLEPAGGNLDRLLQLAEEGRLVPVIDSTYRFDADGVKKAFHVQKSRHAHGKVVIIVTVGDTEHAIN